MAALWWHNTGRSFDAIESSGVLIPVGYRDGDPFPFLQALIAKTMTDQLGFTNVRTNSLEVAGGKLDTWSSIAYLDAPAGGAISNWELVMTAGDTDPKSVNDELVFMLNGIFSR